MGTIKSASKHASPLTLILDSLEQSGRPLIEKFIQRAKTGKDRGQVVFLSLETLKRDRRVDAFIKGRRHAPEHLLREITSARTRSGTQADTLIVIDSLNALASLVGESLAAFLSSLIAPRTSIVGVYHVDVVPGPTASSSAYAPSAPTLLRYLSTTVLSVRSLTQELGRKRARDRSLAEPTFGLAEPDEEGVVAGLGANDDAGLVVELEARRKSGRSVGASFVMLLHEPGRSSAAAKSQELDMMTPEGFVRLHDYPPYRASEMAGPGILHDTPAAEAIETTFDLGLSQKQRLDREKVVLPYFDAQQAEGGAGEGGRILYEMGVEDDFDDEEDEI